MWVAFDLDSGREVPQVEGVLAGFLRRVTLSGPLVPPQPSVGSAKRCHRFASAHREGRPWPASVKSSLSESTIGCRWASSWPQEGGAQDGDGVTSDHGTIRNTIQAGITFAAKEINAAHTHLWVFWQSA